jgi:hypothetical protein
VIRPNYPDHVNINNNKGNLKTKRRRRREDYNKIKRNKETRGPDKKK